LFYLTFHIRHQVGGPPAIAGVGRKNPPRQMPVFILKQRGGHSQLPQIADPFGGWGEILDRPDHRNQDRSQNSNDGNDGQKFDQGEGVFLQVS
jgi:hypothetical protein